MASPKLTLIYFPIGGRAESIRLTAAVGGIAFSNKIVTGADFKEAQKNPDILPLRQVPILQIQTTEGGETKTETVTQSGAILRYFGKLAGLYPQDILAAMKVDECLSIMEDLSVGLVMTLKGAVNCHISDTEWTGDEKIAIRKKWLLDDFPKYLGRLEDTLKHSESGWLVANHDGPTIADMKLFSDLGWIGGGFLDGIPKDALDSYPNCMALMHKVKGLEKIQAWMDKYPKPYGTFDYEP